jgi:hypothetical protein
VWDPVRRCGTAAGSPSRSRGPRANPVASDRGARKGETA